jgi:hypothetical protein
MIVDKDNKTNAECCLFSLQDRGLITYLNTFESLWAAKNRIFELRDTFRNTREC